MSSAADKGIQCPKCWCRRSTVYRVTKIANWIRRTRICDHCGQRYTTNELAEKRATNGAKD